MSGIVGVDVGGTYVRTGLVDELGEVSALEVTPTSDFANNGGFLEGFARYLVDYRAKHRSFGVSVGFPSTIDKNRKILLSTPNIPGLDEVPIVDILEKRLNCTVWLDKDVNHLLIYDIARLELSNDKIVLGIYIGTGLGNAIFLHGKLLRGAHGASGELGHIPIIGTTEICTCGNVGCSEIFASGKALRSIKDTYFPESNIEDIFVNHACHESITKFINDLAIVVATEINILDPDCIIIGGGIAQMKGFPIDKLKKMVMQYTRKPFPANGISFYHSCGDKTSGVVGAAMNVFLLGGIN